MNRSVRRISWIMCLGLTCQAFAETNVEDNIIISAYRTPAAVIDVGSSVTRIDGQHIEDRQSVFVSDLLQDMPGVAVSRSGGYGSLTALRIRGAEANHVLVRIDGIEVNDPAGTDAFGFAHLTGNGIGSIEVVRGPQSAVWGSDALAGVVDIRTRRASQPFEASGFAEGGALGTIFGGVQIGSAFKSGGINFSGSRLKSSGSNISRTGDEDDGYENQTFNLTGNWQASEALEFEATLRRVDSTNDFDGTDFFTTGLSIDSDQTTDSTLQIAGLNGKLNLFDDFWSQSLRATVLATDNENFTGGITDSSNAADKLGFYYQSSFNFGSDSIRGTTQSLTFAADFEREDFSQRGLGSMFGDPNQDQDMHNLGLVAEYRVTGLAGLSASFGLRRDNNSEFDNVTTWRTTAAYRIESINARLHASYGTGHKSPTFTERFGFTPDQFIGNPNLKPEQSRGFDVGYEQSFLDQRVTADITYFRSRLKDEINGFLFDPTLGAFGSFTASNRSGDSQSKGIELSLNTRLTEGLSLFASYTYIDASEANAIGVQQREIRRPQHMAALNINYEFYRDIFQINLNISHNGEQEDIFFPPFPAASQIVSLDSYTLVNLSGSAQVHERISVYARVENLFDEEYENIVGFATPDIGAFAGVRVAFGD